MIRKMIQIEETLCNGCGACVAACHEGAIEMVNGKARLTREDYCDGLGDCLPACPTGAITFVEREAPAYDAEAVQRAKEEKTAPLPCGCPGHHATSFCRTSASQPEKTGTEPESQLAQWPVQIRLVPVNASYFRGADVLVAADCTAYAYGNFHARWMTDRVTLIGCPKLDEEDYAEKLTAILATNEIRSLTVVRMEVPCCGGIQRAAQTAVAQSGKQIPLSVVVISTDGRVIAEE